MGSYQSIPDVDSSEVTIPAGKTTSRYRTIVGGLVFVGLCVMTYFLCFTAPTVYPAWPNFLVSQAQLYSSRPTTTQEALDLGWVKSDEACVPSLGQPWLFQGVRSAKSSVTLYFTPETESVPGALSAIEVDYYGYLETNLIGSYFDGPKESDDGTYYSLAVTLRNSENQDLCSDDATLNDPTQAKYLAIAPDMANIVIPTTNTSQDLNENWREGSCIREMGFHWVRDVIGGKDLSFKAEDTQPIVPMYDPADGNIVAIFFLATNKKQNWASTCSLITQSPECIAALNFWDPGLGLLQKNYGRFYMCSNLCGDCQFTGSEDGTFTTMHWFFKPPEEIVCIGSDRNPYCPSGEYPEMLTEL